MTFIKTIRQLYPNNNSDVGSSRRRTKGWGHWRSRKNYNSNTGDTLNTEKKNFKTCTF